MSQPYDQLYKQLLNEIYLQIDLWYQQRAGVRPEDISNIARNCWENSSNFLLYEKSLNGEIYRQIDIWYQKGRVRSEDISNIAEDCWKNRKNATQPPPRGASTTTGHSHNPPTEMGRFAEESDFEVANYPSQSPFNPTNTQQTQHDSGGSKWYDPLKSVMSWGSSTSSEQAEQKRIEKEQLKRTKEEESRARIRAMQEADERAQKEYEEEMRKLREDNERVMRGLTQEREQMLTNHEVNMNKLKDRMEEGKRAWEEEQLKILNAFMQNMVETKRQVLELQKEANGRQEEFFKRERARNEEELRRQRQENERLCRESKEMARQREESKRAQEKEDREHEKRMKQLEKEAKEERERKDREYKKQQQEEDRKRKQEYEARKAEMDYEAKKREEERQRKHKEHMDKLEREREQRRAKHQKLMDEFARMEEEYLKRRRERARLGEEERRQFEEDIRKMREERMRKQAAYEEYLRNMNQTIATMLAIQKSDQMMQAEYNKLCNPLTDVISSISSEAGLLINWISRYSGTAGFEDQLLQMRNPLMHSIELFKAHVYSFFDAIDNAPIPSAYRNWITDVTNNGLVALTATDLLLNAVRNVQDTFETKNYRETSNKLSNLLGDFNMKVAQVTGSRVYNSPEKPEPSQSKTETV